MTRKQSFYVYSVGAAKVARQQRAKQAGQIKETDRTQKSSGFVTFMAITGLAAFPVIVAIAQGII